MLLEQSTICLSGTLTVTEARFVYSVFQYQRYHHHHHFQLKEHCSKEQKSQPVYGEHRQRSQFALLFSRQKKIKKQNRKERGLDMIQQYANTIHFQALAKTLSGNWQANKYNHWNRDLQ